ncbi:MAG: DNA ligase D, partial [Formivibrio sp.]|nr:DNA ligase D [Formivibrio sp.]
MVVLNEDCQPDFQALQNAFEIGRSLDIVYYLFDAPFLNGHDVRQQPVEQRRRALQDLLEDHNHGPLRFSSAFSASHQDILESACAMALEGVMGKRAGSHYVSRRSADWIKLKCRLRQEFVIVGYTQPKGSRNGFGALLLAVHANGGKSPLLYAGRVGTGFNEAKLAHLHEHMQALQCRKSPLDKPLTSAQARGVHWIKPVLVAEVEFAQWTRDGVVRQAAFIALHSDKPQTQIVRESALNATEIEAAQSPANAPAKTSNGITVRASEQRQTVAGVSISHPDRVIDTESGIRKVELAEFYQQISDWILPQLSNRPVALLRAPEGILGEQFFQKHADRLAIPNIKQLDPKLDPGHAPLMEIDSLKALIGAAQMGCIEFHTWGARNDQIEKPDRVIFDLDPDPALPWRSMLEATQLMLTVLDELGLQTWLKTSGGKGMHLIVPLRRHADWPTVKAFAKAMAQFMTRQLPERF